MKVNVILQADIGMKDIKLSNGQVVGYIEAYNPKNGRCTMVIDDEVYAKELETLLTGGEEVGVSCSIKNETYIPDLSSRNKFELISQSEVDELEPYVDMVLKALGHPEALVTDESNIYDFIPIFDNDDDDDDDDEKMIKVASPMTDAQQKLGISISGNDRIIEVAHRLKNKVEK